MCKFCFGQNFASLLGVRSIKKQFYNVNFTFSYLINIDLAKIVFSNNLCTRLAEFKARLLSMGIIDLSISEPLWKQEKSRYLSKSDIH